MWKQTFESMVRRLIRKGRLTVTGPDDAVTTFGPGNGPEAAMRFTDPAVYRRICLNPELGLGEGYMDGTIEIDPDGLEDLLRVLMCNLQAGNYGGEAAFPVWVRALEKVRFAVRGWVMRNTPLTSRQNVAHHYDLSDDLYKLFLDEDWQYSCAYFSRPGMTLEEAQAAKKAHIAQKLMIRPDDKVLDIGCGWGGMALTLARDYGARVVGVTLSENQLARARARAEAAGLSRRVEFRLLDYRKLNEQFDRIVSVGMLEHVGAPQYQTYFDKVRKLLAPDGAALIHTIGRVTPPTTQSPWLSKYIFPGGYVPSMSEMVIPIETSGLWCTDFEVLRTHYALTLREWRARFEANLDKVRQLNDERFIRMWRFYLEACAVGFEEQRMGVFQMQLAHHREALPLTRDYIYTAPAPGMLRAGE